MGTALFCAAPAGAIEIVFPSQELQALTSLHRGGSLVDNFQALSLIAEQMRQAYEDPLEIIDELILAENWEAWRMFQATPGAAVPLAATQLYVLHMGKSGKRTPLKLGERALKPPKVRVDRTTETETVQAEYLGENLTPSKFESLFRQGLLVIDNKKGGNLKEPFKPADQTFAVLEMLFEGDGPLSGRPWTWENFLPRLLTITVYVVGGLLLIEFAHLVVLLGLRGLGRRRGAR